MSAKSVSGYSLLRDKTSSERFRWKAEIESKTAAGLFKVMIYHGANKTKSKNQLKNADVVLTTYQTMANESAIQVRTAERQCSDP